MIIDENYRTRRSHRYCVKQDGRSNHRRSAALADRSESADPPKMDVASVGAHASKTSPHEHRSRSISGSYLKAAITFSTNSIDPVVQRLTRSLISRDNRVGGPIFFAAGPLRPEALRSSLLIHITRAARRCRAPSESDCARYLARRTAVIRKPNRPELPSLETGLPPTFVGQ
jgi:hypothetical protein